MGWRQNVWGWGGDRDNMHGDGVGMRMILYPHVTL